MGQEQKPFEIKSSFTTTIGDFSVLGNYISKANAEIRRLQEALKQKDDWTPITSVEQVERLVPGVYLFKKLFPLSDLDIVSAVKSTDLLIYSWAITSKDGSMHKIYPTYFTNKFASYRLIHAFEESEKKYNKVWTLSDMAEWDETNAAGPGSVVAGELARDLLDKITECKEKDARIRELEGK